MPDDEFSSSSDRADEKAKSPHSGLPYHVPASQSGMRDKLPRISVPPGFYSAMNHVVATGKIPQFREPSGVIRYLISVGLHSLQQDMENPEFDGVVNHWSTLAALDMISNKVEGFRGLANKVEEITRDRDTSPEVLQRVRDQVTRAIANEDDEYYKRELEQMLVRIR